MTVCIPGEDEREFIHRVIFDELCCGIISAHSLERLVKITEALAARGARAIILGCTEIALLLKQENTQIPLFDTTAIHSLKAVQYALTD